MLGILLADSASVSQAIDRAKAAPDLADVRIFLMDDGVLAARELAPLIDDGVEIIACATDAEARGLAAGDTDVRFGSQYDHALMVRDATSLATFTGCGIDRVEIPVKRVGIRLTRNLHGKLHHGLRAALAYAALGMGVSVSVDEPARASLSHPELERALATLRRFGTSSGTPDLEIRW